MQLKVYWIGSLFLFLSTVFHAQESPADLPGLLLWVKADEGVDTTDVGKVTQWNDLSGNENHLVQETNNFRPVLLQNQLGEHPGITFDGVNDLMLFPELENIRSVFWVIRESEGTEPNFRGLLGHSDTFDFIRGPDGFIWHPDFTNPNILNGDTRLGFENIDGVSNTIPTGFQVFSLVTSGNVEADNFTKDRNLSGRVWKGEILEMLIYSDSLAFDDVIWLENHLAENYVGGLNLGDDIEVEYGFCDTMLLAPSGFESYLWSDGSELESIAINQSGDYWLEVVDAFGRVIRDSVLVSFPGNLVPLETSFCSGEEVTWDIGLSGDDYDFLWQDNSTLNNIVVNSSGFVNVQITDSTGCIFQSQDFEFIEDDFTNELNLGSITEFCSGDTIRISGESDPEWEFIWSDESSDDFLIFDMQPEIWVEVINENGCLGIDTIQTTWLGNIPSVDFEIDQSCQNLPVQFTDLSLGDSEISNWQWSFGDQSSSPEQNPLHDYINPGWYNIELEVFDVNGCSSAYSDSIEIHPQPIASFSFANPCAGSPTDFIGTSTVEDGVIENYFWEIEGENLEGVLVSYEWSMSGFQEMTHIAETEFACRDTVTSFVEILPSPLVSFSANGFCLGELTDFISTVDENGAGALTGYLWDFGDGTGSTLEDPSHLYGFPDIESVVLSVGAENGCIGYSTLEITISQQPQANFSIGQICPGEGILFNDLSIALGSELIAWNWLIDEEIYEIPDFTSDPFEPGTYPASLEVENLAGCTDEFSTEFSVPENITASIEIDPPIALPPVSVDFSAESDQAVIYVWEIDGELLEGPEQFFSFENGGIYSIDLSLTDEFGCTSNFNNEFLGIEPLVDLEVISGGCDFSNGAFNNFVTIASHGNYTLTGFYASHRLSGGTWVQEWVEVLLEPESAFTYQFQSELQSESEVGFICFRADPGEGQIDQVPENNEACKSIEDTELEVFTLFPNPVQDHLTLHFNLPSQEIISIEIFDMQGKILWLNDSYFGSEGFNSIRINALQFDSGSYSLRLTYLDQEIQKMFFVE